MAASAAEPLLEGMMAAERRTQILQMVRSAGRVKVNELPPGLTRRQSQSAMI